ncbi:hypothetical protein B9T23_01690 [Acinetobacter terrae]|uniref:phage tail protein n=1 Tax=Acinetobacter terrae TaxID=2731247 RepID=UPI000A33A2D4|nr:phage tail protein [Acinetobacter terrae]OTG78807.1 hypothetical protein B9T23_01690 [Acinetobacter terrae]
MADQVTGYKYYAKFALFIGNTIENLNAINFDKRGWITKLSSDNNDIFTIVKPDLFGENEGGVVGTIDVRYGLNNQSVSGAWKKEIPLISSYPYQSYLVFRGIKDGVSGNHNGSGWINDVISSLGAYNSDAFYVGNSGYMKEMLLWPKRIHVRNDGRGQWYDEKSEIPEYFISNFNQKNQLTSYEGVFVVTTKYGDQQEVQNSDFFKTPVFEPFLFTRGYTGLSDENLNAPDSLSIKYIISNYNFGGFVKVTFNVDHHSESLSRTIYGSVFEVGENYIIYNANGSDFGFEFVAQGALADPIAFKKISLFITDTYAVSPVDRLPNLEYGDMNPIHKIREILTDDTAMNKPESSVNNENFIKAADRIYEEGLGISWSITEKSCIDAINELCYHIEAGIRVNRQTGLYEMVLFRDHWFEENEIHTISESKIKSMQYEITNADEVINQVNVNYYDRSNIKNSSFSISESGLIQTLGQVNAETLDFPYFMNMRNAEIVANWKLKQLSTGAFKGSFTTGWREARKWNRYDLIRLPWSKRWTGTILVRIMSINLGGPTNNEVSIEFIEVIPATGMMNTTIVVDDPIDTKPEAPKRCNAKVFELPYFEAVQAFGEREVNIELTDNPEAGYLCAIAEKSQNNSLNAALHVDSGNGFERVATINYCETAYLDQSIDRITNSFVVKDVGNIASVRTGSQIFINDEIMVYQSFDAETKVLMVKRGAFGIPQNHSLNSILYFADDFIAVDQTIYVQSEVASSKVLTTTPSGVLALADAENYEVEFKARAIRPYPPANVKINGEYWPAEIETDLILTWVDRNRVQQTGGEIIGWYEGGVTIEPGTTTHLNIIEQDKNGVVLATHNANVTGTTSYTIAISAIQAETRTIEIHLKTVRDGYDSYHAFNHIAEIAKPFSAPYNLNVEYME